MLYITGDTHGNQLKWLEQIHPALSPGDGVIVAGDFGYGFWSGPLGSEDAIYDWLAAQPYAVFLSTATTRTSTACSPFRSSRGVAGASSGSAQM